MTTPGARCFSISRMPKRPSPCRQPITPIPAPAAVAPRLAGYLLAGTIDITADRLHECANIAPQQPVQNGQKSGLRGSIIAATTRTRPAATPTSAAAAARSTEKTKSVVERVDEQSREMKGLQALDQVPARSCQAHDR